MPRACDVCATRYEPHRSTSRYCSDRCRTRAHRSGLARPATGASSPRAANAHPAPARSNLTAAVLEELRAASKETTTYGQACLALAQRIDEGTTESGSAIAALNRELRATMEIALRVPTGAGDLLDELARKRSARLGLSGG